LMDVQPDLVLHENHLSRLAQVVRPLRRIGLSVQVFTSPLPAGSFGSKNLPLDRAVLVWESENLAELLSRRLRLVGEESIGGWLPPGLRARWGGEDPNLRLIELSGNTPAGLMRAGNRLLALIGKVGRDNLSLADLKALEQDEHDDG
jgi:hypothetical protein